MVPRDSRRQKIASDMRVTLAGSLGGCQGLILTALEPYLLGDSRQGDPQPARGSLQSIADVPRAQGLALPRRPGMLEQGDRPGYRISLTPLPPHG